MPEEIDIDEELRRVAEQRARNEAMMEAMQRDIAELEKELVTSRAAKAVPPAETTPPIQDIQPEYMEPSGNGLTPYFGPGGNEPHASSFIAPHISDLGEVMSPGRDDSQENDARNNFLMVQAIRTQGQDEFQRLVAGGAAPEEAFRQAAPKLFAGDPAGMAKIYSGSGYRSTAPVPPGGTARVQPMYDTEGNLIANAITDPSGRIVRSEFTKPPTMPPEVKVEQGSLLREIARETAKLRENEKYLQSHQLEKDATDAEKTAYSGAKNLVQSTQAKIAELEAKLQRGSTNWQSRASQPVNPDGVPVVPPMATLTERDADGITMRRIADTSQRVPRETQVTRDETGTAMRQVPATDEQVSVVSPDGIPGKVPRSKLAAALKAGYKAK